MLLILLYACFSAFILDDKMYSMSTSLAQKNKNSPEEALFRRVRLLFSKHMGQEDLQADGDQDGAAEDRRLL